MDKRRRAAWAGLALCVSLLPQAVLGIGNCTDKNNWCIKRKADCTFPADDELRRNCMRTCGVCDPSAENLNCSAGYYRVGDICQPCGDPYTSPPVHCNGTCAGSQHGPGCNLPCGHCVDSKCHRWTGRCLKGCQVGWVGLECKGLSPEVVAVVLSGLVAGVVVITATAVILAVAMKRRYSSRPRVKRRDFSPHPLPSRARRRRRRVREEEEHLYDTPRLPQPRFSLPPRPHLFNRLPPGHLPAIARSVSLDDLTYFSSNTLHWSRSPAPVPPNVSSSDLGTSDGSEDAVFLERSPHVVYFSRRAQEQGDPQPDTMCVEASPTVLYMSRRAAWLMADRSGLQLGGIRSFEGYMDMSGTAVPAFLPFRLCPLDDVIPEESQEADCPGGGSNGDAGFGGPERDFTFEFDEEVPLPLPLRRRKACAVM